MKRANKLGWYMLRRRADQKELVDKMPDGNATALWLFEGGQALPTKDDLAVIYETLKAKPTDIWSWKTLIYSGYSTAAAADSTAV